MSRTKKSPYQKPKTFVKKKGRSRERRVLNEVLKDELLGVADRLEKGYKND